MVRISNHGSNSVPFLNRTGSDHSKSELVRISDDDCTGHIRYSDPHCSNADFLLRYLEIGIKQCRNGGIDCKMHGLQVIGKKRSEEDAFSSNLSFLTSDSEEFDDQVLL